ncbi:hypothetical protein D3C71_2163100 [compost metagenome]
MARITFMPPPVEPAQAPMKAVYSSRKGRKLGHRLKSSTPKPVVANTETTWKAA